MRVTYDIISNKDLVSMINCTFEDGGKASLRHVVVHALVEKNGAILLEKRAPHLSGAGKWGLPGGFLDRDETAKEAVLRELLEETGYQGEIITLFRINSNPQRQEEDRRQNVALEYLIKPMEQVKRPDKESTEIKWVPIEKINSLDFAFDHGQTVKLYLDYRQKKFTLPLIV